MIASLADLLRDGERRDPPLQPITPFAATFAEELVVVSALLERTAVFYSPADGIKRLARLDRIDVNPDLFRRRESWKEADGSRRSENGSPDYKEAARQRGRNVGHLHRVSKAHAVAAERNARLQARGLAWCSRGKHEVPLGGRNGNGWCRACYSAYVAEKRASEGVQTLQGDAAHVAA